MPSFTLEESLQAAKGLKTPAMSRLFYPEAHKRSSLGQMQRTLCNLYYEPGHLEMLRHTRWPTAFLQRQAAALKLAQETAYERACSLYFSERGWLEHYLGKTEYFGQPVEPGCTWHFFVTMAYSNDDATKFRQSQWGPQALAGETRFSVLLLDAGEQRVQLARNSFGQISSHEFGSKFIRFEKYDGTPEGLHGWAMRVKALHCQVSV